MLLYMAERPFSNAEIHFVRFLCLCCQEHVEGSYFAKLSISFLNDLSVQHVIREIESTFMTCLINSAPIRRKTCDKKVTLARCGYSLVLCAWCPEHTAWMRGMVCVSHSQIGHVYALEIGHRPVANGSGDETHRARRGRLVLKFWIMKITCFCVSFF